MKINPRNLALAGMIGAMASGLVHKAIIKVINPSSPDAEIVIPFIERSKKNIINGKSVSIPVDRPFFITQFFNIYIMLLVAGTLYNRKEIL